MPANFNYTPKAIFVFQQILSYVKLCLFLNNIWHLSEAYFPHNQKEGQFSKVEIQIQKWRITLKTYILCIACLDDSSLYQKIPQTGKSHFFQLFKIGPALFHFPTQLRTVTDISLRLKLLKRSANVQNAFCFLMFELFTEVSSDSKTF